MDNKKEVKKEEKLARKRKSISCLFDMNNNMIEDEDEDLCRLSLYLPYDRPITRSQHGIQQQQQPSSSPLEVSSPSDHNTMIAGQQVLFRSPELLAPSPMLQTLGVHKDRNLDEDNLCRRSLSLAIRLSNTRSRALSPRQQQQEQPWLPPSSPVFRSDLLMEPLLQTSAIYGYFNNEQLRAPSARRVRRNPRQLETETIPPPYPWAKDQRATIHTLTHLESKNITTISGEVQCKRCEKTFQLHFHLREKFTEIANFIITNKGEMRDRAPTEWTNPKLATCKFCNTENSAKPVVADDTKTVNWLFLLLGGMLGFCTLEQLKYFCKYTRNHRTGAKDRVLYLTYLDLCKQLDPKGPFDHDH